MSEEVKEVTKKKSKLPVIVGLVVVLAAGGFFGMKMKGAGSEKVKLGEIQKLGEFLLNLDQGDNVYLRAEIALQATDKLTKEELDKVLPAVQDRVIQTLSSKSRGQVSAKNRDELKKELATSINEVLIEEEDEKAGAEGKAKLTRYRELVKAEAAKHQDWDSGTGPVVKVYFTSFATQ